MKILPINNQNQISHKAVNQKFFNQAKNDFIKYAPHHNQGHLLTCIGLRVAYKLLSPQDAIDTLEAIKPYAQNALEVIENMIIDLKDLQSNQ